MKRMSAMHRNSGLSVITAVFLLLILSALGLFIVNLSTVQNTTSAFDLQGSRAYHAARTGLEFGAFQAIVNGSCPATTSLVLGGALADFTGVTVSCASTGHTEGVPPAKTLYRITAVACNQPTAGACPNLAPRANYVERELQLSVINPP